MGGHSRVWSQTQGRSLVISSKANRYFLFICGMQKARNSIMLLLTKTTTAKHQYTHRNQTDSESATTSIYPVRELRNDRCLQRGEVRTLSSLGQMQLDADRRTQLKLLTD